MKKAIFAVFLTLMIIDATFFQTGASLLFAVLLVPDIGERYLLDRALKNIAAPPTLTLRLYTNALTPIETHVAASFTEATAAGYAAIVLAKINWTIATAGATDAVQPEQTFTFTAAETVEGYYITDDTANELVWAERFAAPANVPAGGGDIKITPKIELA